MSKPKYNVILQSIWITVDITKTTKMNDCSKWVNAYWEEVAGKGPGIYDLFNGARQ